jgi:predicted nucleic acid-binding protein
MKVFVDSNIPMYVAGAPHKNRDAARRFLDRVSAREVEACTSSGALQEILWRYSALGRPDMARQVYDLFVEICPVVLPVTLADTDRARDLLCDGPVIPSRAAMHAAVMLNHRVEWIATFDEGFDKIPGLRRMKL